MLKLVQRTLSTGHVDAYIRDTSDENDLTPLNISQCTSSMVRIDAHLEDRVKLRV
jgi:hypothetical protein